MDPEKEKKRQTLRLIVTEILMFLSAVSMVIILVLVVSGYWINENFEMSRSGMLQISSTPSWALVEIDGQDLSQRTNVNRVIPTGTHTVKISKEGYDEWSKTVNIKEGLLYRLRYPRLFPMEREAEKTPLKYDATRISISPKNDKMLLLNSTTKWSLINLDEDDNSRKELNLIELFPDNVVGEVLSLEWAHDQNRILLGIRSGADEIDWIVLDLANLKRSVKLTDEFGVGFSQVNFANNAGDLLLTMCGQNLQQINLGNKSISAILAEKVGKYYRYDEVVVFTAVNSNDEAYVGTFKLGKNDVSEMMKIENVANDIFLSRFYDNEYLTIVAGSEVKVFLKNNLEKPTLEFTISFESKKVEMSRLGEFLIVSNDNKMATLDMESETMREWEIENGDYGWLDESMIYAVRDGELIVYDYDGLNRRVVAQGVSGTATITNDKWLYYISDDNLVREGLNK